VNRIELRSDNAAGVAPEVMRAAVDANEGSAMAYGGDDLTARLRDLVAETFEASEVSVWPVSTGTAANSIALAAMCPPWGSVLCHESAHILRNEGGATSMFSGGAVMKGVRGDHARVDPDALRVAIADTTPGDPHHSQPRVLSLTCPSDMGTVYSPTEITTLATIARSNGMRVHLDGARLANAVVANSCPPSALTTHAGLHAFSLGSIKNGGMSADAIVSLDPTLDEELLYRTKRAGHVASKMRYASAQLVAHLEGGLWLRLAERSNTAMSVLAEGLSAEGCEFLEAPAANMAFIRADTALADALDAEGLDFYRITDEVIRFVTSWQTSDDDAREVVTRWARARATVSR
jgi:threonine aldolase